MAAASAKRIAERTRGHRLAPVEVQPFACAWAVVLTQSHLLLLPTDLASGPLSPNQSQAASGEESAGLPDMANTTLRSRGFQVKQFNVSRLTGELKVQGLPSKAYIGDGRIRTAAARPSPYAAQQGNLTRTHPNQPM